MSVILDALKKAQTERKDLTKNLPYDPKKRPQKPRWPLYVVASVVFCLLLIFLLIPDSKKPAKPPVMETKVVQARQESPSVTTEKAPSVMQSTAPVTALPTERSGTQRVATKDVKPVKEQKKIGMPLSKRETDKKGPPVADTSRQVVPQDGSKVLITSVDHEKINATYNEAIKETEKGNISGAKRLYQSILAEQPNHIEALNNLGVIAMREGNTKEALFYFNKVLQYKKDYGKAYNNIGLLMMKDSQGRLAEEYFRKSIEIGKDGIEPSLNLAALLRSEKRYEEASRLLEGFISGNTKNRSLYLSYALIKDDMGRYEEAIKYYKLYLREGGGMGERNEVIERLKTLENIQSSKSR
jgi:tetratricopeptide (TPR) repeat protein